MISNLAYVHPDAKLGEGVQIDPFAYIAGDVEIGAGSHIHTHAVILEGARMGEKCTVHSGAVVSGIPQDLKFKGEYTTTEVGSGTMIRECATINRGSAAKGKTVVGKNCLIMAYAHVAHDCVVGDHVILVNNVSVAGEVEIGDWAILGGHTAVHQFVRIGSHAMISGGSLVTKDIPPYIKAAHQPVSYVGVNSIGLRRRGFDSDGVNNILGIYRLLFQSGMNYSNALNAIEEQIEQSSTRDEIISFVRDSKRGIIKPYNTRSRDEDSE